MRKSTIAAALVTLLAAGAAVTAAHAQDASADQLIEGLKPKSLGGLSKGLHKPQPVSPGGTQASPAAASSPAASQPRTQPRATAQAEADNPSVSLTVEFRTGSADLTPAAIRTLDQLGRALSSATLASYKFRIEGHTDTVGSKDANQALSERRAQAVVAYLQSKYSVSADRLQAVGMGEQGLAIPTGEQVAEPRNRRVQVVNLGA